jgi:hypothetical protein
VILYKKHRGKFIPIARNESFDISPFGWYLVRVFQYGRTIRQVKPDNAAREAALDLDAMTATVYKARERLPLNVSAFDFAREVIRILSEKQSEVSDKKGKR